MNGLISDPNIALSSLQYISANALSKRNHQVKSFGGGDTSVIYHDVLCVALETKFQYISFVKGERVAVFDIAVIDTSLISPGKLTQLIIFDPMTGSDPSSRNDDCLYVILLHLTGKTINDVHRR